MTFVEFRERLPENPVILIPLGSHEEQGPHAPMGDFMLTKALSLMIAEKSGALAAPTLPFGYADFFKTIAGGIQLRPTTFMAVVEDMLSAFLDHGLDRLLILNGHTTNAPLIEQTVRQIRNDRGVAIPSIDLWQSIPPALWNEIYGTDAATVRGHGGDPLTSIYLYLFPEMVRTDLIKPSSKAQIIGLPSQGVRSVQFEGMPVNLPINVDEVNKDGMLGGAPERSSAETGQKLVEHLVGYCSRFVEHMRNSDLRHICETKCGEG
ncbi:creatininase family protein [Brucellaceae bacterium C25G]